VISALKAAFVQGRLTADELDERVGQALAARTYAELAAFTTDLPADPTPALQPAPAPPPAPARRPQNPAPETGRSAQYVQAPGADPVRRPHGLLATGLAG
jgi:Domain of unknown function (DUF1707)